MLRDNVKKYFLEGNYNCAESIVHAANDYYGLELNNREIKLAAGFGGGIQTGNLCGVMLGSVSVLSMLFIEEKAHESQDIKPVVTMFLQRFADAFDGMTLCSDIKPLYFKPEVRCYEVLLKGADVLEQVIKEYKEMQK